jgi:hypothetical protein
MIMTPNGLHGKEATLIAHSNEGSLASYGM